MTFAIDCPAGDLVARLLDHRQAFTGDQRFVGMAAAFNHFAVHRKPFAGFDQHPVIELQRADRNVLFEAVDHTQGALRAQCFKGMDGTGGLALGAAFQIFAQQHQCDNHR